MKILSQVSEVETFLVLATLIATFNYVCRLIVNMFYCGRILFNGFKHADIKDVRYENYENSLCKRQKLSAVKNYLINKKKSIYKIWKPLSHFTS